MTYEGRCSPLGLAERMGTGMCVWRRRAKRKEEQGPGSRVMLMDQYIRLYAVRGYVCVEETSQAC